MKILLVSHCFPPAQDGGSVTFGYLKEILLRAGNRVEVITSNCFSSDDFINSRAKTITPQKERKKDLLITRVPVFPKGRKIFRLAEIIFKNGLISLFKKGPIFKDLKIIFKKRKADWVISGFFPTLAPFWGYLAARANKAKFALVPGFHLGDPSYQNRFLFKLLEKADLIFCFMDWEKNYYRQRGIKEDKIKVIGNVAPQNLYKNFSKKKAFFPKIPAVLYLGAKAAHKRIEFLIEAMEIIWRKNQKAHLLIAGPETLYSPQIIKRINKLKPAFKKQVEYYSLVSEKKKTALLDKATVLVNPALAECFSLVIMDSWSRKKPVIGADLPVKNELITDKKDGFLFKENSPADLADKIVKIIFDLPRAQKMGEAGYQKLLNNFTLEKVGAKFLKALKQE